MGVIPSEGSRTFLWQICTVTTDAPSPGASASWWCRCGAESIGEKQIHVYGPCVFSNRDTPIVKKKKGGGHVAVRNTIIRSRTNARCGNTNQNLRKTKLWHHKCFYNIKWRFQIWALQSTSGRFWENVNFGKLSSIYLISVETQVSSDPFTVVKAGIRKPPENGGKDPFVPGLWCQSSHQNSFHAVPRLCCCCF